MMKRIWQVWALMVIVGLAMCVPIEATGDGPLRRLGRALLSRPTATNCPNGLCPSVRGTVVQQRIPSRFVPQSRDFITTVTVPQLPLTANTAPKVETADPPAARPEISRLASSHSGGSFGVELSEVENRRGFRRELVKAAQKAARNGEITRREALRVRVACFSPAFLEKAQELCVVQMAFSDTTSVDKLPRKASGEIDTVAIDWEGFGDFLVKIIPLIIQLISAFGV